MVSLLYKFDSLYSLIKFGEYIASPVSKITIINIVNLPICTSYHKKITS